MIIASNFKTNHTRKSTKEYLKRLNEYIREIDFKYRSLIFPSFLSIDYFELDERIKVGVQNGYPAERGSFTGEIGNEQLKEFNIKTILIGHSERRHILKESQDFIIEKFNFYKERDFEIVYCIGEPLEIRKKGVEEVLSYLWKQLERIDINYKKLIIAYEPVWAIGTGVSATNGEIKEIHSLLRKKIKSPLLYGGSVKVSTIKEILEIENCDGVLVGTASWNIDDFCQMINIANKFNK